MTVFGELDRYLLGEGRHEQLYEHLGAHVTDAGVAFAVWAPNASAVSVVGDFNGWEEGAHPLEAQGASGVWAAVVSAAEEGQVYKYAIRTAQGELRLKTDPVALRTEEPPKTGSVVSRSRHSWFGRWTTDAVCGGTSAANAYGSARRSSEPSWARISYL